MKYDFSGWATRNDILCTDGRTIRKDAFKECDGKTVPLVWNHQHNDPENVLGHALLKNMDEGVLAYCTFNDTKKGQSAKMLVEHGDVDSLSIFANRLKQEGGNVLHGDIKEVSLVLAGANSGAHIVDVIRHGEISEDEFVFYAGEEISFEHGDGEENDFEAAKPDAEAVHAESENSREDKKKSVQDVLDTFTEKQRIALYSVIGDIIEDDEEEDEGAEDDKAAHADSEKNDEDGETVGDILETLNDEQKEVAIALIAQAVKEKESKKAKHSDEPEETDKPASEPEEEIKHNSDNTEGGTEMHDNIFERNAENTAAKSEEFLSHSEQVNILNEARNSKASLRDVVLQHGITDISNAYPDPKIVGDQPQMIIENQDWVNVVLSGVHHTPFARIKTLFADMTADEARAKGYLTKGTQKIEEVLRLLKRETSPARLYKLQKLDKDDIDDITDFDIVAWLKKEMQVMLDAEEARAILIGDGRGISANDKIDEEKIRPIWKMEDLFAIPAVAELESDATADDIAKAAIRAAVKGFDDYDGSGNTVGFIASDRLSDMLLLEDNYGHRLYKTKTELAAAMGVNKVVGVPPMKNKSRTVTISGTDHTRNLIGIIVDLRDYNVGQTKGGQTGFFDDFNLDFNKMEYLLEKRESGTLVKPKSAIVLEYELGE